MYLWGLDLIPYLYMTNNATRMTTTGKSRTVANIVSKIWESIFIKIFISKYKHFHFSFNWINFYGNFHSDTDWWSQVKRTGHDDTMHTMYWLGSSATVALQLFPSDMYNTELPCSPVTELKVWELSFMMWRYRDFSVESMVNDDEVKEFPAKGITYDLQRGQMKAVF